MIEIILTSSVLILLLAILRRVLRGRISPRVQYALWLLVAARLLIPGTLFTAPVSVLGAAEGLQVSLHQTFPDPENLPDPVINGIIDQQPQPQISPAIPPDATYPDEDIVVNYQTLTPEIEVTRQVCNWPDIIWKTGMTITGAALLISNLIFYLRLRKNRKRLTLSDTPWTGDLLVYEAEGLPSPCLFGLFRPVIYLNEAAMDAEYPEHILAHEYAHYRHGDHVWAVLRSVCLAVHWYNPLVWWAAALSRRDCELACDESAIRRLGESARIDYGQTLLGMVSKSRSPAALLHTATTMTAGKRAMTERIALIVKQPRMRRATLVAVALLTCLLAACAFGGKAETQELPGEQEPLGDEEVEEPPYAETEAEAAGSDVLDEVLERLDALRGEEVVGYHFTGKLGAPGNAGYSPEKILPVLEETFRACQWTRAEEHPPEGYITGDIRDSSIAQMEAYPYWESVSIGGFTFFDGHPYVLYAGDETEEWYCVPKGWVTVQAALFYDTDTTHTLEEKKGLYLYESARGEWNTFQYGWMHERYDGIFENEEGVWPSVGFFESVADMQGYLETMFSPEIAEYLLNLHPLAERDGRLHVLSGGGASNIYAGDENVDVFTLTPEEAEQYGYDGHIFAQTPVLDEDLETILGYKRHDYFYSWNGTHYVFENFGPSDDVDPQIYHNAEDIVKQIQQGVAVSEWLPLMNYMDWQAVARAAVNAGMDDGDGSLAIVDSIGDLTGYAEENSASMSAAEYLYILTATEGLDGAPAEGYAYLIYRMYELDPSRFAYVVLAMMPELQRNEVLDLFRGEWMSHREPYTDTAPSREEAIALLEAELADSIWARPANMTLRRQGESFQLELMNAPGIYALTYTSSDPDVAEVDDNGVVTAAGPGTAEILLHFEGAGGTRTFTCMVLCVW